MESFQQDLSLVSGSSNAPTNEDIEAVIQMATSARPSPDGRSGLGRDTRTQLFVGNLPYRVRWQDLKDFFRKAGTVLRADVSLGSDNRSRGYGTVLLATAEDAARAVEMFNGQPWQNRILEVRLDRLPSEFDSHPQASGYISSALSSSPTAVGYAGVPIIGMGPAPAFPNTDYNSFIGLERATSTSNAGRILFVGNLPFHCQWQDLKDLFRQAGSIVRADVALGLDGRSRGFGTVVLANEVDAERAVKMFNGYEYNGRLLKVHYDKYSSSNQTSTSASLSSHYNDVTSSFYSDPSLLMTFSHIDPFTNHPVSDFRAVSGPSFPFEIYQSHHNPTQASISQIHSSSDSLAAAMLGSSMDVTNPNSATPPHSPHSQTRSAQNRPRPYSQHHAHPGPISIPPLPPVTAFPPAHTISPHGMPQSPMQSPMPASPLHHLSNHIPMTPHGLPPITPSMPPFSFLSQPSHPHDPHHVNHSTASPTSASSPNGLHCLLSPFSPGATMSPGALYGRPGAGTNPFINPAVGAPVHSAPPSFEADMGGSSVSSGMGRASPRDDPIGYFPPVPVETPFQDMGYFPPMSSSSRVTDESLMEGKERESRLADSLKGDVLVPSPLETEAGAPSGPWNTDETRGWAVGKNEEPTNGTAGKASKNEELPRRDVRGKITNDAQGHSRTYSLSSPSSNALASVSAQRSDSDPVTLQALGMVDPEKKREEQVVDGQSLNGFGLGLGLGI